MILCASALFHTANRHTCMYVCMYVYSYLCESWSPVVPCTTPILWHIDVFWVIEIGIGWGHDTVDDTRLKINQDRARYIMFIICLEWLNRKGFWKIVLLQQNMSLLLHKFDFLSKTILEFNKKNYLLGVNSLEFKQNIICKKRLLVSTTDSKISQNMTCFLPVL